jgi:hypothetical protein
MVKLSLNKAAREAGVAKSTLLDALATGRMSAEKNDKGHWEIDPSELFRVFSKTSSEEQKKPMPTSTENRLDSIQNNALEIEVKMLREQIVRIDMERERERSQLAEQIEALKQQAERQSADHRQALAMLTDQREKAAPQPRRSFWARLVR